MADIPSGGLRAALAAVLLVIATAAPASNFCPHDGKNYTPGATRCQDGERLRCNKGDVWKPVGKCEPEAAASDSNFCPHDGKNYTPGATRCEDGKRLRCNKGNVWSEVSTC